MCKKVSETGIRRAWALSEFVPLDMREFGATLTIRQKDGYFQHEIASAYLSRWDVGTILMSYISITNYNDIPITIADLELTLPGSDSPVQLLPDPADPTSPQTYRFPGQSGLQFDRSHVIPRSDQTLRRKQSIEGLVLGYSFDRIPATFRDRDIMGVQLRVFDEFGGKHSANCGCR